MLHYLDVMIGFVFTMLVLSLAVTAMVQAVPVYLGNLKGVSLQRGLADMLVRIAYDPRLPAIDNRHLQLAMDQILRDPLLSPPRSFLTQTLSKLGGELTRLLVGVEYGDTARARSAVLQREEFVRLLLDFAANADTETEFPAVKDARSAALKLLNLETPAQARLLLVQLRQRIAELEALHPSWSSSQRADKAILDILLNGPCRDFMAKLVGWYDQTIDRVDAAFTARARNWTTVISAALVLVLQLDSLDLLARLNADGALRDKVVASAVEAMENGTLKPYVEPKKDGEAKTPAAPPPADAAKPEAAAPPADPANPGGAAPAPDPAKPDTAQQSVRGTRALECAAKHLTNSNIEPKVGDYANCMGLAEASRLGLVEWPHSWEEWQANWTARETPIFLKLLGMALSLGLLSLGAPFWYEMLSNLIKLRSTIARKDEAARAERQSAQAERQTARAERQTAQVGG